MELFITGVIESLIFPPGLFLLLLAAGVLLLNKRPALGKLLLYSVLIAFYLLSTPRIAGLLISQVETYPALEVKGLENVAADAIVVLAGDWENSAEEYGSDTVGEQTLIRSRYGAFLQRKTGLPILVTGGSKFDRTDRSLAQMMAELLREEFQAGEVWLEDKSRTTGENAFFSKKLLAQKRIDTVYLVTHASHMPRSVVVFQKAGLKVIPAPTKFEGGDLLYKPLKLSSVLPSAGAINISRIALHEIAGAIWYKIRY